jgi:hypothetical protein
MNACCTKKTHKFLTISFFFTFSRLGLARFICFAFDVEKTKFD